MNAQRLLVALTIASLQACGGSDGELAVGPGPVPPARADAMLLPVVTATGQLKVFDPVNPSTPALLVDEGLPPPVKGQDFFGSSAVFAEINPVLAGDFDGTSNVLADAHTRYYWYIKQGQLRRIDMARGNSQAPVRFSSITDACGNFQFTIPDYANPLDTGIHVEVAGTDGDCSSIDDNLRRYVRLGASIADGGITTTPGAVIREWVQAADGGLQALIVAENEGTGLFLRRYDPDFASAQDILELDPTSFPGGGPDQSRTRQYFRLQAKDEHIYNLYRYDAESNLLTLIPGASSLGPDSGRSIADSGFLYFSDGTAIYRLTHDGVIPDLLHVAPASFTIDFLHLTDGYMVFETQSSTRNARGLSSLPKGGGDSLTMLEPETNERLTVFGTSGNLVYYTVGDVQAGTVRAVRVSATGAGSTIYEGASWAARLSKDRFNAGGLDPQSSDHTYVLGQGDEEGVVTATAFEAATGLVRTALGAIDGALSASGSNRGRYVLANVEVDRGFGEPDFDVYFADILTFDSLQSVASEPEANEATR